MLEFLKNLDRRYVFLFIAFSVVIPLLTPIGLPVQHDPEVKELYDKIESLEAGETIVISFDYDPASGPELKPMAEALVHHAFRKKLKVIAIALYPAGPSMANLAFERVIASGKYQVEYGRDYVNLGFYYGPNTGLNQVAVFCNDIYSAFPKDEKKNSTSSYSIMKDFSSLKDAGLVISLSAGDPGVPAYVGVAYAIHGIPVSAGVTAVSAPRFYSYLDAQQLVGLLGGLRGAAVYESLVGEKGKGLSGMDAQSIAHLVIIFFILLSNVLYLIEKAQEA